MTDTLLQEAFKSKAKFSELMQNIPVSITQELANYPDADGKVVIHVAELTQNENTLFETLADDSIKALKQPPYFVWIITNEKEKIMNFVRIINQNSMAGFGIFVFKASLNEDKIDIKCLLKPELKPIKKYVRNDNAPAKLLQKAYWEKYFEVCDELQSEMQVTPKPQHYQYIPMGKRGVQIMQTINTQNKYVATELFINADKSIFEQLLNNKEKIEKSLGELDWQALEGKKSSRIRQTFEIDITNQDNFEQAIKEQIKMAENFKKTFSKYL